MHINIIYASISGNVEATAEKVADVFVANGIDAKLIRSENASQDTIASSDFFVFATSTWEHGELNPFFVEFHKIMQKTDFTNKYAAFIGLGDRRYEPVLFCEGMKIVHNAFLQNNGNEIGKALLIDGEPFHQLDGKVDEWARECAKLFKSQQG